VSKNGTTDHGAGGASGRIDGTSKLRTAGRLRPPSLRDPVVLFWTASYVVFFVIALATPETILDDYPQARRFTDFMAAIVPQIDLVARASGPAAQANRFVYALLWAVIPVYTVIMFVQTRRLILTRGFSAQPRSWFQLAIEMAFGVYVFVDGIFFMWAVDISDRLTRSIFVDLLGRAFWAPLWSFGPVLALMAVLFHVWGIHRGRLRPRGDT
jgi:hypothetical protein